MVMPCRPEQPSRHSSGCFWAHCLSSWGNDASQFVGPLFLNLLLGVVENGGSARAGYTYATLMLVLLLAGTISDNQHFQLVMRAGLLTILPFPL